MSARVNASIQLQVEMIAGNEGKIVLQLENLVVLIEYFTRMMSRTWDPIVVL